MKVTLERANLFRALNHVHRVVERRTTIPILSNVLIRADGADLRLTATDLDLEVVDTVPAMVESAGATTVSAHMLYEIVRKLADGSEVLLEQSADQGRVFLKSGRSTFQLQSLPESDYPDLATSDFSHSFRLKATDLKKLIERTQFAISTEETRYYLNGIYFHTVEGDGGSRLRAVATDGHRLAQAEIDAPAGAEGMPGVIIPRKAVGEMQKLIDDPDTEISIELSDVKIRVTVGAVVLTSKLIDGTFPDYERVIPQMNDKTMEVERDPFREAVDRVSTIASERGRAVKLAMEDGRLILSVNNPDSGSATEELAIDYAHDPLEIGFNSKYLLDIADQLETDNAVFRMSDPGSPTLVQDAGAEDALYVLMPMRV